MVIPVQRIPSATVQPRLPVAENLLQIHQVKTIIRPFAGSAACAGIHIHMLELEHHLQFVAVKTCVQGGIFHAHAGSLTHGHHRVFAEYLAVHFAQELVHTRTVRGHRQRII